jgi:hypothetical protein
MRAAPAAAVPTGRQVDNTAIILPFKKVERFSTYDMEDSSTLQDEEEK